MPRNLLIATSTNTQELYDINVCYLEGADVDIGGWFAMPVSYRRYQFMGRVSMVQLLHVMWPLMETVGDVWQEYYVYQNNYGKDPRNSATIHTRHSMCPSHWMKSIVTSMFRGSRFYHTFWDFVTAPVWLVAKDELNYFHYVVDTIVHAAGPHDWLWPSIAERGPTAFYVLQVLILNTLGTNYPVPMSFIGELLHLYSRWQPVQPRF